MSVMLRARGSGSIAAVGWRARRLAIWILSPRLGSLFGLRRIQINAAKIARISRMILQCVWGK